MKFSAVLLCLLMAASPALAADEALSAAANAAYLAANAKKPGTILRPSGLQLRVLRSGVGRRPGRNDVVQIRYGLRLINGVLVDSTTPSLPTAAVLSGITLAGLGEALLLMREGDHWHIVMPPNLGFGASSAVGGAVPPRPGAGDGSDPGVGGRAPARRNAAAETLFAVGQRLYSGRGDHDPSLAEIIHKTVA